LAEKAQSKVACTSKCQSSCQPTKSFRV
jgi:hypothetical protein